MYLTYDARVYRTQIYYGSRVTSYRVRWRAGKAWGRTFRHEAQAEVFRADLLVAAAKGEAFSVTTGVPVAWDRQRPGMSWYEFVCTYVDMKWPSASAKYRRSIAQALTSATTGMLGSRRGQPPSKAVRGALMNFGFNSCQREHAPREVRQVLAWLARNSRQVTDLAEPAMCRRVLMAAITRLDGSLAAPTSIRRGRAVLMNALDYAVEMNLLEANPLASLKWTPPKIADEIDRRTVINPGQARSLLAAVAGQPGGQPLVAFFGVMYYSGLRPEEAIGLHRQDVCVDHDWGELHVRAACPEAGRRWTDDGTVRDRRGLKHRANGTTRIVPSPPPLTKLLRAHLAAVPGEPGQPLFRGQHGRLLATIVCRRSWDHARQIVLSPEEYASPLARRPYDLRHACLSTWLNAGISPAQVAAWGGHSVETLLRVYAKCLDGEHETAKRKIMTALAETWNCPGRNWHATPRAGCRMPARLFGLAPSTVQQNVNSPRPVCDSRQRRSSIKA
jgi:integrase